MKIKLFSLIMLCFLTACSVDDSGRRNLYGVYSEISPLPGRTQLIFLEGNKVIKKQAGSAVGDEFLYQIQGNVIKLTPTWDASTQTVHEFQLISNSKFEVENLYPAIPENPKVFMVFQK